MNSASAVPTTARFQKLCSFCANLAIVTGLTLAMAAPVFARTINELLEAAARQPNVEVSDLAARENSLRQEAATAALYPKLSLFGKAESYNSPTNLRPMPPTEVNVAAGDSLPFSREIIRYGLSLEAPLYVKQVYVLRDKLKILTEKAEVSREIQLVGSQAAVVSLNSAFHYLADLAIAIDARLKSLDKTRDDIAMRVKNGRTPEAELMKIDNTINELYQQKNELTAKVLDVQRDLEHLTGMEVAEPVAMTLAGAMEPAPLIAVRQQEKEVAAAEKEVTGARAARYPVLSLYGTLSGNDGTAYNTDEHISRAYNFAGLVLSVPLFNQTITAEERLARMQLQKAQKKLADTRIELAALEKNLAAKLPIIEQSLELARKSTANNKELLTVAKVAYNSGRTTTEEYLRYEAQVLASQAEVEKFQDRKWQLLAKQAVLYGTNLKGVVQ